MLNTSSTNLEKYLKKIKAEYYWIVAAVLATVIMLFVLSVSNLLTNGKYVIAQLDMISQYFPFIIYLKNVLSGKHSLFFSWSNCLGQGMYGTLSYFTFSPFNIVYFFFPNRYVMSATVVVIALKTATSAAIMQRFLMYFFRRRSYSTVLMAVCYALCAYQIVYYPALNLTDGIYSLPLIMLGIVKLIRERKMKLILISYSLLFAYNFYMGYMLGICSFILGVSYFIYIGKGKSSRKNHISENIKEIILLYFSSVAISLILTAVIWLPAVTQLFMYGEDNLRTNRIVQINPIILVNNLFSGQFQSFEGIVPYIFCGLLTFIMVILYFLNNKISKREKIFVGGVIALFIIIMCVRPLNIIMHAFDETQMLGFRYSFVLSFVLCIIGCREMAFCRLISVKKIIAISVSCIILYFVSYYIYLCKINDLNSNNLLGLAINLAIIVMFGIVFLLLKKKKTDLFTIRIIITMLVAIDLILNGCICINRMGKVFQQRDVYFYGKDIENATLAKIPKSNENDFYRIQGICERNNNLGIEKDFYSTGGYNNFGQKSIFDFMYDMGVLYGVHNISSKGMTDAVKMLLGVEYCVNFDVEENGEMLWHLYDQDNIIAQYLHENVGVGSSKVVKNNKSLAIGYMCNADYENIREVEMGNSPFENQDNLLSALTGEKINCFDEVIPKIETENAIFAKYSDVKFDGEIGELANLDMTNGYVFIRKNDNEEGGSRVRFLVDNEGKKVAGYLNRNVSFVSNAIVFTEDTTDINEYFGQNGMLYQPYIKWLALNEEGKYELDVLLDKVNEIDFCQGYHFNMYNEEEFNNAYNILSREQLDLKTFGDGYLCGKIDAGDGGMMATSIPYSIGWKAKVDGKECKALPIINGAFVGINLTAGEHEIELEYVVPGLNIGMVISMVGILIVIILGAGCWVRTNKKTVCDLI